MNKLIVKFVCKCSDENNFVKPWPCRSTVTNRPDLRSVDGSCCVYVLISDEKGAINSPHRIGQGDEGPTPIDFALTHAYILLKHAGAQTLTYSATFMTLQLSGLFLLFGDRCLPVLTVPPMRIMAFLTGPYCAIMRILRLIFCNSIKLSSLYFLPSI